MKLDKGIILQIVSEHFGVQPNDILHYNRKGKIVDARQCLCYNLRAEGYTIDEISAYTNRKHQTVSYNVQAWASRIRLYHFYQKHQMHIRKNINTHKPETKKEPLPKVIIR